MSFSSSLEQSVSTFKIDKTGSSTFYAKIYLSIYERVFLLCEYLNIFHSLRFIIGIPGSRHTGETATDRQNLGDVRYDGTGTGPGSYSGCLGGNRNH